MTRKYFNASIAELEQEFEASQQNAQVLAALADELTYRTTDRARALSARVGRAIAASSEKLPNTAHAVRPMPTPAATATPHPSPPVRERRPAKPIANTATDILSAWTALEVLAPPTYLRPEALAGGDRRNIAQFERGVPWERGEKAKPGTRVYYQVVLGAIDLAKSVERLTEVFTDSRAERPAARGQCPLAVVIVDRHGRPIEDDPIVVASFGWGLPQALAGRIDGLAEWSSVETTFVDLLKRELDVENVAEDRPGLSAADLHKAHATLVKALELPADLVTPPTFAVRSYVGFRNSETPDPLLVNSFFLRDLATARGLIARDQAPLALRQYLGVVRPAAQRNLLLDRPALANALAPGHHPAARWPGRGRHPLVVLQQAAVNLAMGEVSDGGVIGVNGPPGTGKTTLLRDMVAAVVTDRAKAMAEFGDPETAFSSTNQRLKAGNGWIHLYALAPELRGYELLVASSNNKAVENVSAELPASAAIADDEPGLRYFKTTSDALIGRDSWGLIASVLGNASNRYRFRQTFWWDRDAGLSTYLAAATGAAQVIEEQADETAGAGMIERTPLIVASENPPTGRQDALLRWREARARFLEVLAVSDGKLAELEKVRRRWAALPGLLEALKAVQTASTLRPGFWSRLFRLRRWRSWRVALAGASQSLVEAVAVTADGRALSQKSLETITTFARRHDPPADDGRKLISEISSLVDEARRRRDEIGPQFVDRPFFDQSHVDLQRSTAWLDGAAQRSRDDVFTAAIALHKAFIDAAARPLRHNVGALMNVFGGASLTPEKQAVLPDLWSSLFLITPVISTTFASVDRMLGDLPPDSLGWLLIDEAGQAAPQSPVGALIRCKRAIVVGDPVQIPPVVTLPDTLTDVIQRHFGVDPDVFNAPTASAQTLADHATAYTAEFSGKSGSRTVGVPLLVHRRCAEPMFGIANAVAYDRLMVQAKRDGPSDIRDRLGPSRWIDVTGRAADKWSPEEGQTAIDLLTQLREGDVTPDLYIVTPFVVVKDNLRRAILDSGVLTGWVEEPGRSVQDRVGTVHTVQGREAEGVIFVLGAPLASQRGARSWAGGQPNLLNVAITRAKECLYVVGNRSAWKDAGVFAELARRLPAP